MSAFVPWVRRAVLVALAFVPRLPEAPVQYMTDGHVTIVVPGLYGSTLRERDGGALVWPSLREIVLRRRGLDVCRDDGDDGCGRLVAGAMIESVTVVPFAYEIDVYGSALARLEAGLGPRVAVRRFAYDWRRDIASQAAALDALVETERARGNRVSLVAHSLGGLLTSYWLRYGTQQPGDATDTWAGAAKVERVVLAGVPYGGSVMSFVDLVEGREVALNGTILGRRAYQSFDSTYQLLPDDAGRVLDAQLAPIDAPLLDDTSWRERGWGAFAPGSDASRGTRGLARARELHRALSRPLEHAPPAKLAVLLVRGLGRRTLQNVVWLGTGAPVPVVHDRSTWKRAFGKAGSRVLYGDGDAVVGADASVLPPALEDAFVVEQLATRAVHARILSDRDVVDRVVRFLDAASDAATTPAAIGALSATAHPATTQ